VLLLVKQAGWGQSPGTVTQTGETACLVTIWIG